MVIYMRKDAGYLRKQRLDWISSQIAKDIQKGITVKGAQYALAYTHGLTLPKALEYVEFVVEVHEDWIIQDGVVKLKK